jgi:hypothetical protein
MTYSHPQFGCASTNPDRRRVPLRTPRPPREHRPWSRLLPPFSRLLLTVVRRADHLPACPPCAENQGQFMSTGVDGCAVGEGSQTAGIQSLAAVSRAPSPGYEDRPFRLRIPLPAPSILVRPFRYRNASRPFQRQNRGAPIPRSTPHEHRGLGTDRTVFSRH